MIKVKIHSVLFLISLAFLARGQGKAEISVSVSPAPVPYIIGDMSQRDERPPTPVYGYGYKDGRMQFPQNISPELLAWKEKYTAQADLMVEIKNISSRNLSLFQEWNSWGFCNLKFVFTDGFHEYWVTKQPGYWTRNFPAWTHLAPGESFKIPVAFTERIWENVDKIKADSKMILYFRALYEQYPSTFPYLKKWFVNPEKYGSESWEGSVSSEVYYAKDFLPRFNFRKPKEEKKLKLPSKEFLQRKKEQDSLMNDKD